MKYVYVPIIWPLFFSGFITLSLGIFALLKHKKAKGAVSFAISMFIVTIWSIPNLLEMSATTLSLKLFWANIQYIAYSFSPVSLLILCKIVTSYHNRINKKHIIWLSIIPCITLVLVWTNQWHGLIRYDIHMDHSGTFPVIAKKYGSWFYIHAIYSHCTNLSAVIILLRTIFTKKSIFRKQAFQLLIGTCLIIVPNLIYISGISPLKYDLTPVFFAPAGVVILWSIFHNRMFELVPLARATVIEAMEAGTLVINMNHRVIDMNQAFKKIANISMSQYYLVSIDEVCKNIPELVRIITDDTISHADFTITGEGQLKVYEILLTPLHDKKGYYLGRLAVIYDITEKKQAQQEFLKQQWQLAVIEERERMTRDLHDNLGQVLGFINFQAQGIRQELINKGIDLVSDKMEQLIKVVQQAHGDVREYISNARTSVNSERDFTSSLKNDISNFVLQTCLNVKLQIPDEPVEKEFSSTVMVNIQNMIHEAMNNIRKHAQASEVQISFNMKEDHMLVTIADNGKGFEDVKNEPFVKTHYGLDIMRERATLIGGSVKSPGYFLCSQSRIISR